MGNVDTDKLKQLLYAMIETLDGDNSPSPSPETETPQETPQESPNKQVVNNVRKKKYGTQENLFLSMPEKDMHKNDVEINKYGKKVGTTLKFWEDKEWIDKQDPYGWVQWYCEFYLGRRSHDDERQIDRWKKLAGPKGRFRKWLVTQILKKGTKKDWDDHSISPAIRQTLQHWAYKLKKKDFNKEVKSREK